MATQTDLRSRKSRSSAAPRLIIGVDEAGYGPNLGPLLIAATVWRIGGDVDEQKFCDRLSADFAPQAWSDGCRHVPLGDSKLLYQPAVGLASLEAGLLSMLDVCGIRCQNLADLVRRVAPSCPMEHSPLPWYQSLADYVVPAHLELRELERLADHARERLNLHGATLVGVAAKVVCESQFNRRVARYGSKGQLLSLATLELVGELLEEEPLPVEIFCDRHGGRKNYLPILLEVFPDEWFSECRGNAERCSYRNTRHPARHIHFTVGGDRFPPTGLASMLAKYLRERLMGAFNAYWLGHFPELRPTAGYPGDARRFRDAIELTAIEHLGLPLDAWWRCR